MYFILNQGHNLLRSFDIVIKNVVPSINFGLSKGEISYKKKDYDTMLSHV